MDNRRGEKVRGTPNDNFEPSPSAWQRDHRLQTVPFPQCGAISPSVERNSDFGADDFFQRRRQHPQHDRWRHQWPQSNKQSRSYPSMPQNHYIFFRKSQRLKESLTRILVQALWQIEQWYPDDISDGDLMDWQPEDEIVIRQPDSTVYAYDKESPQNGVSRDAGEGIRRFGEIPLGRHRAASNIGVSGISVSSAERGSALWCTEIIS